jgi:hypothetical protein
MLILTKDLVHTDLDTEEEEEGPGILQAEINLWRGKRRRQNIANFICPGPA